MELGIDVQDMALCGRHFVADFIEQVACSNHEEHSSEICEHPGCTRPANYVAAVLLTKAGRPASSRTGK